MIVQQILTFIHETDKKNLKKLFSRIRVYLCTYVCVIVYFFSFTNGFENNASLLNIL